MRRCAVLSLLLFATLTGCGPGEPVARVAPETKLPREATNEELAALGRAEDILERRCMADAGFDLPPAPEPVRTDSQPPPMALVLADPVWAREHGYGSRVRTPQEIARLRANDPVGDHLRSLTPERRAEALRAWQGGGVDTIEVTLPSGMTTGRSTRGCTSQARGELYGDFRTWFGADAVDRGVTSLAMSQAQADPVYAKKLRSWSDCVARRGLSYESPQQLRDALGDSAPLAKETEYAEAEADCAVRSGLATVARDVEERHLTKVRERYLADVTNARRMRLAALPKARQIVRDEDMSRFNTQKRGTR
nr:hypothetical protein [Streptomyces antibioticus]